MAQSKLLQELGGIDEKIKENYTSERLFDAADLCLYSAAHQIIEYTNLYNECLSAMFSTYTRKKLYNCTDEELEQLMFEFYMSDDVEERIKLLRSMKLNRELILLPVKLVYDNIDKYIASSITSERKIDTVEFRKSIFCIDIRHDLLLPFLKIKFHYDNYLAMREAILQKHYRTMVKEVGTISHAIKGKVDPEDMATELFNSALTAFSKFDITSGPFTTYLNNWLRHGRTYSRTNDEIGISFTIPSNVKLKIAKGESNVNNFSMDIDTIQMSTQSEADKKQNSDEEAIQEIVAMYDREYFYRLLNEMEISDEELEKVLQSASHKL